MNTTVNPQPGLFMRILQYPLTRLILLGGLMLVLYGLAGGFMQKFAGSPTKTLGAIIMMATIGFSVYIGFVHFVERRPVSELALPGMGRDLGIVVADQGEVQGGFIHCGYPWLVESWRSL